MGKSKSSNKSASTKTKSRGTKKTAKAKSPEKHSSVTDVFRSKNSPQRKEKKRANKVTPTKSTTENNSKKLKSSSGKSSNVKSPKIKVEQAMAASTKEKKKKKSSEGATQKKRHNVDSKNKKYSTTNSGGHRPGRKKSRSPGSASKSSKVSSTGFTTPPHKLKSTSRSASSSGRSVHRKLMPSMIEKIPNAENIDWMDSDDLLRVLLLDDPELNQDEVDAYSFKDKIKMVGHLYPPSNLLVPYSTLATRNGIDFKDVDFKTDFSTRTKATAKMSELLFKIIDKEANM